jgi:hypothetical protein
MGTDVQVGPYWLTITFFHFDTTRLWLTYILLLPLSCAHTYLPFALCSVSFDDFYIPAHSILLLCTGSCLYIVSNPNVDYVKATLLNRTSLPNSDLYSGYPSTRVSILNKLSTR